LAVTDAGRVPIDWALSSQLSRILFATMLLLCGALKIWLAMRGHPIRHPDEIFQTIEQSHRIVFGYGIIPWEFREGIRWWGTPLLLTPPLWIAKFLDLGADFYVPLTRGLLALVSLLPVPAFFVLVSRRSGPQTALLACLLPLFWVEHLDFAGSTLSDAIAAPLICTAAIVALLCDKVSRGVIALLGVVIALTFCLRFHLAPALLIITLLALWKMPPSQRLIFVGALAGAAVALGAMDVMVGQWPYQHVYLNIYRNIFDGVAAGFGEEEWDYYFRAIWDHWGWGLVVALLAVTFRSKQTWLLWVSALAIVVTFSLIAHKEYRFYYPATMLFTFAAGWAIAESASIVARRVTRISELVLASLSLTALVLTGLPAQARYLEVFQQQEDRRIAAQMFVGRLPDVCGVGFDIGLVITGTAGVVHTHKEVGFDTTNIADSTPGNLARFNYLLVNGDDKGRRVPSDFVQAQCWADLCVYRRPGPCTPSRLPDGPGP
jgi:GPI mannosyltransferase 3